MKKIVMWLMGTVTALVLLFGYPTSTTSQTVAGPGSSVVSPVTGGSGSSPTGSGGTTAGGTTSSDATSTAAAPTSVTGTAADTRWGPVQVRLSLSDGTITDVAVVRYPSSNGRDQQINARALPILIQETLDAQNSSIDMVSGATYTSQGYLESLQSALDQAGL